MKKPKRTIAAVALISLALFGIFAVAAAVPSFRIQQLNKRYDNIDWGMTREQVVSTMARKDSRFTSEGDLVAWWDEVKLGPDADARITKALRYRVNTFYLPVVFEFTFDENENLVGKHRFDWKLPEAKQRNKSLISAL